jgi:hypothetical protein
MNIKMLAILLSVVIFLFVLDLVRRRKLRFKYALGWLFVSAAAVFLSFFHQVLFWTASALGFELPSNFIFFALSCVFVFLSLLLTVFLCQQNERNDCMAQKIAILECKIKELLDKKNP